MKESRFILRILNKSVKLPKRIKHREEPLTKEIHCQVTSRVYRSSLHTAILVAIASGMRIGEIVQLKISDIDFESRPTKIRIRADTTKTKQSRETFLTNEATKGFERLSYCIFCLEGR